MIPVPLRALVPLLIVGTLGAQTYLSDHLGPLATCSAFSGQSPYSSTRVSRYEIGVDTPGAFSCTPVQFQDTVPFQKALGTHPTNDMTGAWVEFDLRSMRDFVDQELEVFQARVGIDVPSGGLNGARFEVHVDGTLVTSADIADASAPSQILRADISRASTIRLTTKHLGTWANTHACWGDAQFAPLDFRDSFSCYSNGQSIHGLNGWAGWDDNPALAGTVSSTQFRTAPHSLEIGPNDDSVRILPGFDEGQWTLRLWQYIPSAQFTARTSLVLNNQYHPQNFPRQWTGEFYADPLTMTVFDNFRSSNVVPVLLDQWVEWRVEFDLDDDELTFFYGGQLVSHGQYAIRGGPTHIETIDLWNAGGTTYWDDVSIDRSFVYETWTDDFDADPPFTRCNVRGWHGIDADPNQAPDINFVQGRNGGVGLETANKSAVRPFSGINRGKWTLTTWQKHVGPRDSWFYVFNEYQHGGPNSAVVKLRMDTFTGMVIDEDRPETPRPIVSGQYVEVRVEIDLERDYVVTYYNGQQVSEGRFTFGGGPLQIAGLNVFSRDLAYWDDFSLTPSIPVLQTVYRPVNQARYHLLPASSWHEAQEVARQLGGNLVSVTSSNEQNFVYETFGGSRNLWIGLNDVAQEGKFRWVSGATTNYRNWFPGEPNAFSGEHFAHIAKANNPMGTPTDGAWNDLCSQGNAWSGPVHGVVEVRSDGVLQQAINPATGNRYLLLSVDSWKNSRARALAFGGELVTINDREEYDFILTNFGGFEGWRRRLWTGLNDEAIEGNLVWSSGQSGYTKWAPGQPQSAGDYVVIDANTPNWGMRTVNDRNPAFAVVEIQTPTVIEATMFNHMNGHYYHRIQCTDFADAEAKARAMGGNLASISDRAEHDFIAQAFGGSGIHMYIGLTDERVEGTWEWTSGEPVNYTFWATNPQEPNGGTAENYVAMDPTRASYGWVDRGPVGPQRAVVEIVPINAGHGRNCNDSEGVGLDLSYEGLVSPGSYMNLQLTSNTQLAGASTLYLGLTNQSWFGAPLPYTSQNSAPGCTFYIPFDLPTFPIALGDKNQVRIFTPNDPLFIGFHVFFQTWTVDPRITSRVPLVMSDYLWVYYRP